MQENRPADAVTTLAGIVGPILARRYGRLAKIVADDDWPKVTKHDVKEALSLGRLLYEQALSASSGTGAQPA